MLEVLDFLTSGLISLLFIAAGVALLSVMWLAFYTWLGENKTAATVAFLLWLLISASFTYKDWRKETAKEQARAEAVEAR